MKGSWVLFSAIIFLMLSGCATNPIPQEKKIIEIEKNIIELCTGTDSKLVNLKENYRRNPAVIKRLSLYEEDIEPNN